MNAAPVSAFPRDMEFFVDPSRCIGCKACMQACSECGTHKGVAMIHLEYVERADSVRTSPVVCMHCETPSCAAVCPADAIKRTADGVVQTAMKHRCVGCSNCVLACPFGVPRHETAIDLMMKCDMCYDRTSVGKKPMCATVCPSGALFFGPRERIERERRERATNEFRFGGSVVRTKVAVMTAPANEAIEFDVFAHMSPDADEGLGDVAGMSVWEEALS